MQGQVPQRSSAGLVEAVFFTSLNLSSSPAFGLGDVMRKFCSSTYPGVRRASPRRLAPDG
jgi:hypothetical protein